MGKTKNLAAVALAKARHASLTPQQRSEIAAKGARGRWAGMNKEQRKEAMKVVNEARRKLKDAGKLPKGGRPRKETI